MTADEKNEQIFAFMRGRQITDFIVHSKERKLQLQCGDGAFMEFWADDEGYLCFDIDRDTRH